MPTYEGLSRSIPPSVEPITRLDLKGQARIQPADTSQDLELDNAITSARERFESLSDTAVLEQTWVYDLPAFGRGVALPHPPLLDVESVTYIDTDDVEQTLDPALYEVITTSFPGMVALRSDSTLPTDVSTAIRFPWRVTYRCGYVDVQSVPESIKLAIMQVATYYYDNRASHEPIAKLPLPHSFDAVVTAHKAWSR